MLAKQLRQGDLGVGLPRGDMQLAAHRLTRGAPAVAPRDLRGDVSEPGLDPSAQHPHPAQLLDQLSIAERAHAVAEAPRVAERSVRIDHKFHTCNYSEEVRQAEPALHER